jgi:hypothetical protein
MEAKPPPGEICKEYNCEQRVIKITMVYNCFGTGFSRQRKVGSHNIKNGFQTSYAREAI